MTERTTRDMNARKVWSSPASDERRIRNARIQLMHVLEPQDSAGATLLEGLGPETAWDIVSEGRTLSEEEHAAIRERLPEREATVTGSAFLAARRRWEARVPLDDPERIERSMASQGSWLVVPEDEDWPADFQDIGPAQPIGLWGRGDRRGLDRPAELNAAFVGCRDSTNYGNSVAAHLAGDLAAEGYGIVSGAAFGIDAAAHRAALATAVRRPSTVAFLACGIDRPYPRAHEGLLRDIADSGLVLTELNPGCSPMRHRFLQRNRLIAALTSVVVVVEARWRSGALNTAHHAMEFGRTVAAVPGSVFSGQSAGCHRLLAESPAQIVSSTRDLRELLTSSSGLGGDIRQEVSRVGQAGADESMGPGAALRDSRVDLTEVQLLVRDALPAGTPVPPEKLCSVAGLDIRQVIPALAQLEELGLAEGKDGRWRCVRDRK